VKRGRAPPQAVFNLVSPAPQFLGGNTAIVSITIHEGRNVAGRSSGFSGTTRELFKIVSFLRWKGINGDGCTFQVDRVTLTFFLYGFLTNHWMVCFTVLSSEEGPPKPAVFQLLITKLIDTTRSYLKLFPPFLCSFSWVLGCGLFSSLGGGTSKL